MFKKIIVSLFAISTISVSFGQIKLAFDISDNTKKINCYTSKKNVLVGFQVTDSSTCNGNCIYLWQDGESDDNDDILRRDGSKVEFDYASDGEFSPSLVTFADTDLPDSIKTSEILSISGGAIKNDSVEVIISYKISNDTYADTISFSFDQIDTAQATNAAKTIQVYSPKTGVPSYEITKSPNAKEFPDFPYPSESFLYTLKPNENFASFDNDVWVYYWDFGHDTPSGKYIEDKEEGTAKVTTDTIDHLFPYENIDGFTVSLTIALDSTKFTQSYLTTYGLDECYEKNQTLIKVEDEFFGETKGETEISKRDPDVPSVFTPNGDNINEVFTFATSGQDFYTLKVYTRWGNLVFETEGYTIYWDGNTTSGGECSSGVYYYRITNEKEDEPHTTQGFVHLFRE